MKKLIIRGVVVLLVLLVLAVVVSIYFLGSIVKKGVETVGPQITRTEIKLDSATLSLLSGSGKLKGLRSAILRVSKPRRPSKSVQSASASWRARYFPTKFVLPKSTCRRP